MPKIREKSGRVRIQALGACVLSILIGSVKIALAVADPHELFPTGAKVESENKEQWLSVGLGVRTSFSSLLLGGCVGQMPGGFLQSWRSGSRQAEVGQAAEPGFPGAAAERECRAG